MAVQTFSCDWCSRTIGARAVHLYSTDLHKVFCTSCLVNKASTQPMHAALYPECQHSWHDMWDHGGYAHCTRAAYRNHYYKTNQAFNEIVANVNLSTPYGQSH